MKLKSYTNKDRYGNMTSFEFYEGASVDMGDVPPMMQGIPDHPGDPKGTDTVPAWLTPGEFVMNAEATRMFEPQIEQMNNAGRAMQAEQGGTIPEYAAHGKPIYAAAGGNSGFLANILKRLEGVKSEAYLDSAGKATIGAGSTRGVQMGDTASDDQVDSMLAEDIAVVDQDYGQLVSADLNTNQEAAVKSLLFNIGGPQFANSKARAALNAGDFESFKKEAAEFRKVGDKVIPGLENRRAQELALFDSPVGDDPWGISRRQVSTRDNTAKGVFDERIPDLQGRANERTSAEEFSGTGTAPRTAKEVFDERIPALRDKVDKRNLSIPDELSGPEMGRGRTAQEVFDNRVPALQSRVNERTSAEEFSGTGTAPRTAQDIFNERIPALQSKVAERNLSIPDELSGPEMGRGRTRKEIFDSRIPALQDMINPEADEMLQASEFEGLGGVPLMDNVPVDFSQYSDGPFGPKVPDAIGPRSEDQQIRDEVLLSELPVPEIKEPPKVSTSFDKNNLPDNLVLNPKTGKVEFKDPSQAPTLGLQNAIDGPMGAQAKAFQLRTAKEDMQKAIDNGYGPGDAIFDNSYARVQELEGADEKLASLQDKKKLIFTDGELEVTDAAIEKKTIQAEKLVDLGLSDAAKKVEQEVKDLKAKKERLETQSKDLVKDDQTDALDPAVPTIKGVPTIEGVPPKSDADEEGDAIKEAKVFALEEVVDGTKPNAKEIPKDTTPEAATKAGETAPPEQISKAESFLSGIFGDLFDKGELKRMAIMYVGGRMLGGSHNGSLNFAAKQYVNRVDAKAVEKKALEKEKRLDLKAARKEFNKNVFKLETERNFSPKSIKLWKDSYDPETGTADSSLLSPIVKPSPMNIEGPPQLYYPEDGGKPRLGIEVKVGTKETGTTTMIVDPKTREQIPTYMYHQDRSRVKGTDEYKAAYQKDSAIYTTMLADLQAKQFKPGNKKDGTVDYRPTDITASVSGPNIAKWQRDRGVDPSLMPQILESAYANMVASGQKRTDDEGKSVKHKNIEKFLDGAYMPALIGDSSIFNVPGTDKPADFKKLSELTNSLVRQARANPKLNIKPTAKDHEVAKHVYTQLKNEFLTGSYKVPDPDPDNPNKTKMQNIWTDEESKANFFEEARKANKSAFELFIEQKQNASNRKPV